MWYCHFGSMCTKFHCASFLIVPAFLFTSLVGISTSTLSASTDPYDSGYGHSCDDANISDLSDRYINQPEKGPAFHTDVFMQGYYDGYDACTTTSTKNMSSSDADAGSFRINATIDLNREAILDASGRP